MQLAIDANQRIIGANRFARRSLLLDDRELRAGTSLWAIFERNLDIFRRQDRSDISTRLLVAGSNDSRPALVTHQIAQELPRTLQRDMTCIRGRVSVRFNLLKLAPAPQAHGGLSAGAMRRVREYVEVHLGESIDLSILAGVAGLSVHHFARQFKQSAGVSPPATSRKASRTSPGDVGSDGSSVIGNCICRRLFDQGCSPSFPSMLGNTPREFRWSQR